MGATAYDKKLLLEVMPCPQKKERRKNGGQENLKKTLTSTAVPPRVLYVIQYTMNTHKPCIDIDVIYKSIHNNLTALVSSFKRGPQERRMCGRSNGSTNHLFFFCFVLKKKLMGDDKKKERRICTVKLKKERGGGREGNRRGVERRSASLCPASYVPWRKQKQKPDTYNNKKHHRE